MTEAEMIAALRAKGYLIRTPETIQISGIHVPKPLMEPPQLGANYWFIDLHRQSLAVSSQWAGGAFDNLALKRGMLHVTEENAVAHAKALIKVSGGECE